MSDRAQYRVYVDDELLTSTTWPPAAVAAWNRASHDREAAVRGADLVLEKDGRQLACVRPHTQAGHPWPDAQQPEPDLRDLAAALQQLTRAAGIDVKDLADAMAGQGLPTNRARLDNIRSLLPGKRAQTSAAELIVLCYSAIDVIKSRSNAPEIRS